MHIDDHGSSISAPAANPQGGNLGVDDIVLHRTMPRGQSPTQGVFSTAWAGIKARPAETLVLSVLSLIFSECGGGSASSSSSSSSSSQDSAATSLGELIGQVPWQDMHAALDWTETALIAGIGALALFVFAAWVVMKILSALIAGIASSYWLGLVRHQDPKFGSLAGLGDKLVKIVLTCLMRSVLIYVVLFASAVLCIVPIVYGLEPASTSQVVVAILGCALPMAILFFYVHIGLIFAEHVIVDKNLGYLEALRASWRLARGHRLAIFGVLFASGLLNMIGVMCCCVGLIPAHAVGMGAIAATYDNLAEPGDAYLPAGHRTSSPTAEVFR